MPNRIHLRRPSAPRPAPANAFSSRRPPAVRPARARPRRSPGESREPVQPLLGLLLLIGLLAALMVWGVRVFGAETPPPQAEAQPPQSVPETSSPSAEDGASSAEEKPAAGKPASESWEDLGPDALDDFQPVLPARDDSAGPTVLLAQWFLERSGFGPGVLDGRWGSNTATALRFFQERHDLEATGELDRATWDELAGRAALAEARDAVRPLARQRVREETVAGPFVDIPEDYLEMAEMDCLCYESKEEALAEAFHTTPEVLVQLNPDLDFSTVEAGDEILAPAVGDAARERGHGGEVAEIVVSKPGFWLHALDRQGDVLYHFPTTVGASYDPSPSGDFAITAKAPDPNFHYQPELFPEVPDSKPDKMLPPGPNSPVGVMWMQLSKENYGIHGTSAPATIGHTTSHGCVRLTNWDVRFLAERVGTGTPVRFQGEREGDPGGSGEAAGSGG